MISSLFWLLVLEVVVCHGRECYRCRYSVNSGCDIDMTQLKTSQHQVSCDTDCYSQIVRSSEDAEYEIIRDCSPYSACTEASYTRNGHTYIARCCTDELCNADLGEDVFQCFDCEEADGPESTCQNVGFMESDHYSRKTSFCGTYCEKTITSDGSGQEIVRRSCRNDCVNGTVTTFGITTETHCCTGDICNHGNVLKITWTTVTLMAFAAIVSNIMPESMNFCT